ncbi:ABC transporter ATP-binding protein [Lacrimispora brassicae]
MKAIEIDNISKSYALYKNRKDKLKEAILQGKKKYHKDFYALNNVSFTIEQGECVGIIGLNGSGKSTLLKIITGVITPSSGDVAVDGKISALLELGAGFNPEYTGLENIYLNSTLMGYSDEETKKRIPSILEFADIGDFINQPVKTYSSGMFVRLAFSIAINIEPEILIIDEALSVGDVFFQQKCYQKIRELTGRATVLIVSHDMNAMTKFCRRVLVMNHGSLVFDGEPQEAVTRYFKIKQGEYKKIDNEEKQKSLSSIDFSRYRIPDQSQYSGNMNVIIEKYYYDFNGYSDAEVCEENDSLHVSMLVESKIDIENLIVGYQVRDKYGNEVFGQTNLTSNVEQFLLHKGQSLIDFDILWPEVREGDYFITLGIGNGTDVLNQIEECWLNNAIHIMATTYGKTIFGTFNRDMDSFVVTQL